MVSDTELVLDFLNTVDVERHTDLLNDPLPWTAWLNERHLHAHDPTHVRAVRDGLRALVGGTPAPLPPSTPVRIEIITGHPRVTADEVTGAVLAAASRLSVLGDWDRLKICPADECQWAFFDRSRNRSRTWCSMQICGNREKARAWRERSRTT